MSKKSIDDLRAVLFAALDEAKDTTKPLDVSRMRAISEIAGRITDTARVEVEFMRTTGKNFGSGFIRIRDEQDDGSEPAKTNQIEQDDGRLPAKTTPIDTGTGAQSIVSMPGGRVITHKMR